ncbi:MAG: TRAP transporter substrate-binding protein [Campylobacterales bacterium]
MKRRDFVKATAASAIAAPAILSAKDSKKVTLKLATSWPKNFPILQTNVDYFAKRVKEASGGSINIRVFTANELVPPLGVFDATSLGQIDAYHSATYYWSGNNSAFSVIAGVPFGFTTEEMGAWLKFGGGLEIWREICAKYNLYPLLGGNTGFQMGGWFKKEIKSLDNLKGLKMRIPGLGAAVLSKLGVNTVLMPGGELYTALERNTIDAADWVAPAYDLPLELYKVAKYYYTGWYEPASNTEIVFNQKTWNKLSKEQQEIISIASDEMNSRMISESLASNAKAYEKLISLGVEIKTLPEDILDATKNALKEVVKEKSAQNADFAKAWSSFEDFYRVIKPYSNITTRNYLNIR